MSRSYGTWQTIENKYERILKQTEVWEVFYILTNTYMAIEAVSKEDFPVYLKCKCFKFHTLVYAKKCSSSLISWIRINCFFVSNGYLYFPMKTSFLRSWPDMKKWYMLKVVYLQKLVTLYKISLDYP